jgi:hypothetical protein
MARNPALDGDASVGRLEYGSPELIAPSTEAGPRRGDRYVSPAPPAFAPALFMARMTSLKKDFDWLMPVLLTLPGRKMKSLSSSRIDCVPAWIRPV